MADLNCDHLVAKLDEILIELRPVRDELWATDAWFEAAGMMDEGFGLLTSARTSMIQWTRELNGG